MTDAWHDLVANEDGRYLAALWRPGRPGPGSEFSRLTVWDVDTGERRFDPVRIPYLRRIDGDQRRRRRSSSSAGASAGRVQIRDGATGELLRELGRLPRPDDAILRSATAAVAFTPDGDLAVGSQLGPIRVVDPHTGVELRRIDSPQETSNLDIFFTQDGSEMVTLGSLGMMRFDVASGEPLWSEPRAVPYCSAWAYAERLGALLCGDASGQVIAYDVATGAELGQRFDSQLGGVCSLAVSADGTRFAEVSSCYGNATIVEWRLDGGGPVSQLVVDTLGEHHVRAFGAGGDVDALVAEFAGEGDDALVTHVIDASTGAVVAELPGIRHLLPTDDPRRAVAYFPEDGTVGWYDVEQRIRLGPGVELDQEIDYTGGGRRRRRRRGRCDDGVDGMRSPGCRSRRRAGRLTDDRRERRVLGLSCCLRTRTRSTRRSTALHDDPVYQVQRRDPESGAVLASAAASRTSPPAAASSSPARPTVASSSSTPRRWSRSGRPSRGSTGPPRRSLSTTLGQRLMVLGNDETLRIFDVATRTQLGDAIDLAYDAALHTASIRRGRRRRLRSDGMQAAADTGQGIVVWDLDPAHWVDAACRLAGRNLTHAEWDQYIGDLAPYRRTCPTHPDGATI